ncbi:MAG: hypothetical protein F6K35_01240 [Okeania sp. SIO2H7]|nr:hypothetical protein [Okeania sp. SIO2H7]
MGKGLGDRLLQPPKIPKLLSPIDFSSPTFKLGLLFFLNYFVIVTISIKGKRQKNYSRKIRLKVGLAIEINPISKANKGQARGDRCPIKKPIR